MIYNDHIDEFFQNLENGPFWTPKREKIKFSFLLRKIWVKNNTKQEIVFYALCPVFDLIVPTICSKRVIFKLKVVINGLK